MITIYHNPRCRKSREGLALLESSGEHFKTVLYLDNPPTEKELGALLQKLGIPPEKLLRKNEAVWKENFKGNIYSDAELIRIMVKHPKLIERPIVVKGDAAVIGRPAEQISNLLSS